jgi:aspartyl protease
MRRPLQVSILLLLSALVISAQAPLPAATPRRASEPQTKHEYDPAIEVPVEFGCGKAVFIHGKMNGTPALTFLIDSGGGSSYILDLARAQSFRLEPYRRYRLEGGGQDYSAAFSTAGVPIELPGVTLRPSKIVVADLTWLSKRCGMQIDGIIGYDLFRSYAVEISYSKKMLRLYDSNFQYNGQGDRLPITEDRDHLLCVPAQLELTTDAPVDVRLVVDTGATVPIAFTREFVEKHQLMHKLKRDSGSGRVQGMGGKSQMSVAEAKSLKLGNFLFRDLRIGLSRDHTGGLAEGNYDGIMGAAMLSKFDLIFDLEHQQLILESNFSAAKSGAHSGTE